MRHLFSGTYQRCLDKAYKLGDVSSSSSACDMVSAAEESVNGIEDDLPPLERSDSISLRPMTPPKRLVKILDWLIILLSFPTFCIAHALNRVGTFFKP